MSSTQNPFLDKVVEGLHWVAFLPQKNYYILNNLALKDGDVILSTYPKCGTNWVMCIMWLILHPEEDQVTVPKINEDISFVDERGLGKYANSPDSEAGRVLATHFPSDRIPKDSCAKYINIVRNPFDCVVSYFHFLQEIRLCSLEIDGETVNNDFFEWFMAGQVPYNDFFDHVKSWYNRRNDENVLMMQFEDLKKDHRGGVLKIAKFLGREELLLADGGKLLDKVVHQSSFKYMKENLVYISPTAENPNEAMTLVRKGKVGGFRDALTPEQVNRLREKMEREMAGTELLELWQKI